MPYISVVKESGELLFDTRYITYGLIKSGYLAPSETWKRKVLRSVTNDPDQASSYIDSTREGDQLFSISVLNSRSPLVFLAGKGVLQGTYVNGAVRTFYFVGATTATRAYVFDLMADDVPGSPYIKTYNEQGVLTFNSLQPPMNVLYSIAAPGPGPLDQYGRYPSPYAGGAWQVVRAQTASVDFQSHFVLDVELPAGDYAVALPWSRTAFIWATGNLTGVNIKVTSIAEGAYGRSGGMSFMFATAAASAMQDPSTNQVTVPASASALPLDRVPSALVISTSTLPLPYN